MEENKTFELCDNCGQETEINGEVGGYCSTCGKFLKPCSMCNMDEVNCNECKMKVPKKFVFVLIENGMWDYEQTNNCTVFDSFEKAREQYIEQIKLAKEDMLNFADEKDIDFEENKDDAENLEFSIYEVGDYTKNHCDISVKKLEIL